MIINYSAKTLDMRLIKHIEGIFLHNIRRKAKEHIDKAKALWEYEFKSCASEVGLSTG